MSQVEKLIERFCNEPTDFTYDELRKMLSFMGYEEKQGNGSRVKFIDSSINHVISLHKPHPENTLKLYVIRNVKRSLREVGKL